MCHHSRKEAYWIKKITPLNIMYFELILMIALFLPIYVGSLFLFFWLFWTIYKDFIQWFRIKDLDLEIYAERIKDQDKVIARNALENFVHFLGTIYMIWGLIIWAFLQFEATYVFVAPLDKSFPAIALLFVGYAWISASKTSLLSRKSVYCRVKKKRND